MNNLTQDEISERAQPAQPTGTSLTHKRKRPSQEVPSEPNNVAETLFQTFLTHGSAMPAQPAKRRALSSQTPLPQPVQAAPLRPRASAASVSEEGAMTAQPGRAITRPGALLQRRMALKKTPVKLFEEKPMDESVFVDWQSWDAMLTEEEKKVVRLNYILGWINFRLVEKKFAKQWSGLYLWSYNTSVGKTLLCRVLGKVFKTYHWVFEDKSWQQEFSMENHYECIVYNAVNGALLPFRQVELHGDRDKITIMRRNQKVAAYIRKDTPYIFTSNLPPEQLGYDNGEKDMEPWKERMLVVCVDEMNLFELVEHIRTSFGVVEEAEDVIPERYHRSEI